MNIVDHHKRVAKGFKARRVAGILLGTVETNSIRITNSFAMPFDEDTRDYDIWFTDTLYIEKLAFMMKKINTQEVPVGWYSTGSNIKHADTAIHESLSAFCSQNSPLYLLLDVGSHHLSSMTSINYDRKVSLLGEEILTGDPTNNYENYNETSNNSTDNDNQPINSIPFQVYNMTYSHSHDANFTQSF